MLSGNIAASWVVMKKLSVVSCQQKPLFIAGALNSAPVVSKFQRDIISEKSRWGKGGGGGILACRPDELGTSFLEPCSEIALRRVRLIRSCSQKAFNIHVILNEAQRSEESRRFKKRDSSLRSE
jgi:hypothetical protein